MSEKFIYYNGNRTIIYKLFKKHPKCNKVARKTKKLVVLLYNSALNPVKRLSLVYANIQPVFFHLLLVYNV